MRNCYFLFIHVSGNIRKQRRTQIAFARVRQHAEHGRAFRRFRTDAQGASKSRPRGDADKDPFLLRQIAAAAQRVGIWVRRGCPRDLEGTGTIRNVGFMIGVP